MEIYKITNNITGEFYIGKNESKDNNYFGSGNNIKKSIEKYGKENHTKHVIATISSTSPSPKRDLIIVEGAYIREYFNNKKCLNISRGASTKNKLNDNINYDNDILNKEIDNLKNENALLKDDINKLTQKNKDIMDTLRYFVNEYNKPKKNTLGKPLSSILYMNRADEYIEHYGRN